MVNPPDLNRVISEISLNNIEFKKDVNILQAQDTMKLGWITCTMLFILFTKFFFGAFGEIYIYINIYRHLDSTCPQRRSKARQDAKGAKGKGRGKGKSKQKEPEQSGGVKGRGKKRAVEDEQPTKGRSKGKGRGEGKAKAKASPEEMAKPKAKATKPKAKANKPHVVGWVLTTQLDVNLVTN